MAIIKYLVPLISYILFFGYITNPHEMYQYPRRGPEDPTSNYTPQLFLYGQLGPFIIMASIIVAALIPERFNFILPARPVEFYFGKAPSPNSKSSGDKAVDDDDVATTAGALTVGSTPEWCNCWVQQGS